MVYALYANGMIGGEDLRKEVEAISNRFLEARAELLSGEAPSDEEGEFQGEEAPLFSATKPKE